MGGDQSRAPLSPHVKAATTATNLTAFVERCLKNLEVSALDLRQIHCPPTDVYYMPEVFGVFDDLVKAGKVRFYGVSVERVEEGLKALEYPGRAVTAGHLQRSAPAPRGAAVPARGRAKVGILARLPLSSGMLTGKLTSATRISARTTIAPSIATVRRSTRARLSLASTTSGAWPSSRSCARCSRRHDVARARAALHRRRFRR